MPCQCCESFGSRSQEHTYDVDCLVEPRMVPLDTFGDLIPIKRFMKYVENGMFIDYDGFGYLATSTQMMPNKIIKPSHVETEGKKFIERYKKFTHIMWFNR